jgi:Fur family ferric uptake transcriptional regulator
MNNINPREIIKLSGLKITSPREMLIELLNKSQKPICYNDIKNDISMDKATFYRTMNSFEVANIVSIIDSSDKKRYYELKKDSHSHFSCNICHGIECINSKHIIDLVGYDIQSITIHGVCATCNKK